MIGSWPARPPAAALLPVTNSCCVAAVRGNGARAGGGRGFRCALRIVFARSSYLCSPAACLHLPCAPVAPSARQSLPLRASRSLCEPVAPQLARTGAHWRALARTGATGAHWRAAGATGAQLAGAGLAYFSRLLTASVSNCAVEEYVWDDSEGQGLGGKAYSGTVTQCWGSVCSVAGVVSEYSWAIGTTCVERSTTCVPAQRLLRAALQSHLRRRICV